MNGPAVQDLWLFLAGSRDEMAAQLGDLLEGYGQFCPFDYRELQLIEALRALRLMHYTAWITRRWHDPAFPRAFPWLADARGKLEISGDGKGRLFLDMVSLMPKKTWKDHGLRVDLGELDLAHVTAGISLTRKHPRLRE